jgi:putative addiction module component (TIGR02574 family)
MEKMHPNTEKILTEALRIPPEERALIAERLITSLDSPADLDVEAAWQQEVQKRLAAIDRGEVALMSWEEARQKLRSGQHAQG